MLENLKLRPIYDGFLFLAEARRNPPVLRSHHHIELELNLVVRGSITYVVHGRRYSFHRGTLLWMFPQQEHQLVDRTGDAQYYVAVFKPGLIARACTGEAYRDLKRQNVEGRHVLHTILDPRAFTFIKTTMDTVMEGSLDPDLLNREAGFGVGSDFRFEHGDPDALNAGLHHLLIQCWRTFQAGHRKGRPVDLHPAVRRALEALGREGGAERAGALARACAVSPSYLSRLFHRQVGVPIHRYRNSVRLGRFMEIWRTPGKKTLLECVYAAGFGSYAQFYKVFSASYGEGPRHLLGPQAPAGRHDGRGTGK